jgi:hypothetical protein
VAISRGRRGAGGGGCRQDLSRLRLLSAEDFASLRKQPVPESMQDSFWFAPAVRAARSSGGPQFGRPAVRATRRTGLAIKWIANQNRHSPKCGRPAVRDNGVNNGVHMPKSGRERGTGASSSRTLCQLPAADADPPPAVLACPQFGHPAVRDRQVSQISRPQFGRARSSGPAVRAFPQFGLSQVWLKRGSSP